MQRKKILWLCSWYPSKGDPFNGDFVQRHARAASLFNDITVIHVYPERGFTEKGVSIEINGSDPLREIIIRFRKASSLPGRLRAYLRLRSLYRKAVFEHIRAHGQPDLVHVHVPVWAGEAALWLKKKRQIPFVVTEHWGIYNEIEENNFQTKSFRFRRVTRAVFSKASAFLSVSDFLAAGVNRMVCSVGHQILPNVVDTRYFFPANRLAGHFRFIHVSNMVPLKNTEGILRAFDKLVSMQIAPIELMLVGPAPESIRSQAAALPSGNRIIFRGEVSYEQVAQEMQASDCLVLFSRIENSPCVIGEALCCGVPVISSSVGGVPELLDETNSILIPAFDETALVEAMKKMLEGRRKFDAGSIAAKAKEKHSYQAAGRIMDETYRKLIP